MDKSIQDKTGDVPTPERTNQKRKKRRWLQWVIIILVVLMAFVVMLPTLMSTGLGKNIVVSIANGSLRGRVEIESLDLGWTAPIGVKGLRLYDPQDRMVVDVPSLSCEMGLWGAIFSPGHFESLNIQQSQLDLYLEPDGTMSLLEALPEPSGEKEKTESKSGDEARTESESGDFAVNGKIFIKGAVVRIIKPDGRELVLHNIDTDLTLKSLNDIVGDISMGINDGGGITLETKITDQANVDLSIDTTGPIDLKPISHFLEMSTPLEGLLKIEAKALLNKENQTVKTLINLTEFRSSVDVEPDAPKISVVFRGDIDATPKYIGGKISIKTESANLDSQFDCNDIKQFTKITKDQWIDAVLHGKALQLPAATLDVKGKADLVALTKSFPQLARLSKQTTVKSGRATLDITAKTQPKLNVVANLDVTDLAGIRTNAENAQPKPFQFDPIKFALRADIREEVGVNVKAMDFQTQAGGFVARGTASKFAMNLRFDLARLREMLNQLISPELENLEGVIDAKFNIIETSPGEYTLAILTEGTNLLFPAGAEAARFDSLKANFPADISIHERTLTHAILKNTVIEINDYAPISLKGSYDKTADKKSFALFLKQLELGNLDAILQNLNIDKLKDYRGSVDVTARGVVDAKTEDASLSAQASIKKLRVLGALVDERDAPLNFKMENLVYNPAAKSFSLNMLEARHGRGLNLDINKMSLNISKTPKANGDISLATDLAYIRRLIAPMLKPDEIKDLAGQLTYRGTLAAESSSLDMKGQGSIKGLVLNSRKTDWGDIILSHRMQFDTKADLLKISQMQLSNPAMNMKLLTPNTITDVSGEKVMDIRGEFNGSWPKLIELAQNLMPALKKDLALDLQGEMAANTGRQDCEFTLTGPLDNPKLNPKFKSLKTQTALGWKSGKLLGLDLGGAKFVPDMKEGRLTFGKPRIPASGGMLNIDGAIDFTPDGMVYNLPGKHVIIDNVMINPEVGELILSRFNPLFAKTVQLDGKMNLALEDMHIPFGDAFKINGKGKGKLDLSNLKMRPGKGGLVKIFEMASLKSANADTFPVKTTGVDFEIKRGRIYYDNFTIILGSDFDMIFSGWVGFDDTLDMKVSIPIRVGVLAALNIAGPTADYARVLEKAGVRISIPIRGTRGAPRLDLSKVDTKPLIQDAVKGLLQEQLKGNSPQSPKTGPAKETHAEDMMKNTLKNIFKQRK